MAFFRSLSKIKAGDSNACCAIYRRMYLRTHKKKAKFHNIFINRYILKSSYLAFKVLDMNSFR